MRTRTYSFTIYSKDALVAWTYLCTIHKQYQYMCMNMKKNTIQGYMRFKNAVKIETMRNLLHYDADIREELKNDIDVRKSLYCKDKFYEDGIPIKNKRSIFLPTAPAPAQHNILYDIKQIVNDTKHIILCKNARENNEGRFNLDNYLNNLCKDAMNFDDFLATIGPDPENVKLYAKGFVYGTIQIITNAYNKLDLSKRPFYCTDKKRKNIYIKINNVWTNINTKEELHRLIHHVVNVTYESLEHMYKTNEINKLRYINIMQLMLMMDEIDIKYTKIIKGITNISIIDKK